MDKNNKIITFDDLSNDDLLEKLKWLYIELREIESDITSIENVLDIRKCNYPLTSRNMFNKFGKIYIKNNNIDIL